jgi:tetratricopeptide (TPR) repeat protein
MLRYVCFFSLVFTTYGLTAQEAPQPRPDEGALAPAQLSPLEQEIHSFFQRYQTATQAESVGELVDLFDFDQIASDVVAQSGVNFEVAMQQQVAMLMRQQFIAQAETLDIGWTRHRIMRIEFSGDHSVADAYVRSWCDDDSTSRELFVLKQIDGEWRICDFTELSLGVSTVSMTAMGLRESIESSNANEMLHGLQSLTRCAIACRQGDAYGAVQAIDGIIGYVIPESMQSLRWQLAAAAHSDIDPAATIEMLDKAAAYDSSAPLADYLYGNVYLALGRNQQAVKHYRAYLNRFGADADAYYGLGLAYEELEQVDEAIAAYKDALVDTPESTVNLQALALILPESRKHEIASYFRALPDPAVALEEIGDACFYSRDPAGLDAIVQAAAEVDPDMPLLAYFRALLEHLRGNHETAFEQLATIMKDKSDQVEIHDWQEESFCDVARHCNKIVEAYELCLNKDDAIATLINRNDSDGRPLDGGPSDEAIKTLVARYLAEHENQYDALYNVATSYLYNTQQYELAREYLFKAIDAANNSDQRDQAVSACVQCYVSMQRPLDAYADLTPKEQVLNELQYSIDDESELAELIKLHRETHPHSPRFLWEDLPKFLTNKEYQAGLDRLAAVDAEMAKANQDAGQKAADENDDDTEAETEDDFDRQWRNVYRTRFLIGLQRYDEALIAAHSADENSRDFLRALLYAAKGNRTQFQTAYARCVASEGYYGPMDFQDAPEVPADWLPESSPESGEVLPQVYESWNQVRRVVFLLSQPQRLDAQRVIAASQVIGEPLFAIDRHQMTTEEDDYVFQANEHCVMISTEKCRYFVHWGEDAYLHDADLLASECVAGEAVVEAIKQHRGWIAIEIFQWPQDPEQVETRAIPVSASKRMAEFARQLGGDVATVALNSDSDVAVAADEAFFQSFAGDSPIEAFQADSD